MDSIQKMLPPTIASYVYFQPLEVEENMAPPSDNASLNINFLSLIYLVVLPLWREKDTAVLCPS